MTVTIDKGSGFCFGVERAIEQAEQLLKEGGTLYCLGDIVHNKAEIERLESVGLRGITHEEAGRIDKGNILFRAHGEPPSSYLLAARKGLRLTDATCPIVKKLQERVGRAWEKQRSRGGQVVIFGNPDHPETKGLMGHTGGSAVIVSSPSDTSAIDPGKPVELFSQTTMNSSEYRELEQSIKQMMFPLHGDRPPLKVHNTICGQISGRTPRIRKFASEHEVIVFVGGRQSSNAGVLFRHCREVNSRSHFVSLPGEVSAGWFSGAKTAGVCGATSTPQWLMEQVADSIARLSGEDNAGTGCR
jgi:4-hydroxy-3-methylbut-2-en-1-yl diphosphate reductase